MTINYINTRADYVAHYYLLNPAAVRDSARNYYSQLIVWWVLSGLGIYLGFKADMLFASCIFAAALSVSIIRSASYRKAFHEEIEQFPSFQILKEIALEVTEDGLTEVVDGIKSFAPWDAVRSYQQINGRLFLELAAGNWAIIPKQAIKIGSEHFDDLLEQLAQRKIINKSEQAAAANRDSRGG